MASNFWKSLENVKNAVQEGVKELQQEVQQGVQFNQDDVKIETQNDQQSSNSQISNRNEETISELKQSDTNPQNFSISQTNLTEKFENAEKKENFEQKDAAKKIGDQQEGKIVQKSGKNEVDQNQLDSDRKSTR
eukprot:TRINITY_DN24872_c0_g1_i2.p1 TRINITY_DN24872_c0_g1~~TRINITY_DN24872_c0_g1_i2.p1  ORF type:complete len:134 (-),score=26.87 TRINITY_DN24872_c0_g1_i2:66-467(-)